MENSFEKAENWLGKDKSIGHSDQATVICPKTPRHKEWFDQYQQR